MASALFLCLGVVCVALPAANPDQCIACNDWCMCYDNTIECEWHADGHFEWIKGCQNYETLILHPEETYHPVTQKINWPNPFSAKKLDRKPTLPRTLDQRFWEGLDNVKHIVIYRPCVILEDTFQNLPKLQNLELVWPKFPTPKLLAPTIRPEYSGDTPVLYQRSFSGLPFSAVLHANKAVLDLISQQKLAVECLYQEVQRSPSSGEGFYQNLRKQAHSRFGKSSQESAYTPVSLYQSVTPPELAYGFSSQTPSLTRGAFVPYSYSQDSGSKFESASTPNSYPGFASVQKSGTLSPALRLPPTDLVFEGHTRTHSIKFAIDETMAMSNPHPVAEPHRLMSDTMANIQPHALPEPSLTRSVVSSTPDIEVQSAPNGPINHSPLLASPSNRCILSADVSINLSGRRSESNRNFEPINVCDDSEHGHSSKWDLQTPVDAASDATSEDPDFATFKIMGGLECDPESFTVSESNAFDRTVVTNPKKPFTGHRDPSSVCKEAATSRGNVDRQQYPTLMLDPPGDFKDCLQVSHLFTDDLIASIEASKMYPVVGNFARSLFAERLEWIM